MDPVLVVLLAAPVADFVVVLGAVPVAVVDYCKVDLAFLVLASVEDIVNLVQVVLLAVLAVDLEVALEAVLDKVDLVFLLSLLAVLVHFLQVVHSVLGSLV